MRALGERKAAVRCKLFAMWGVKYKREVGKMKKSVLFAVAFLISFLTLNGCTYDPYSEQRPYELGNASWVCTSPEIRFDIDTSKKNYYEPIGEAVVNGQTYPCKFAFITQTNELYITFYEDSILVDRLGRLECSCEFFSDHMVVTVDNIPYDYVYEGRYPTFTFERQDLETK